MSDINKKIKIAISWQASCGGCDESILDIDERIIEFAKRADVVFWPCIADFKYQDIEKFSDDEITAVLINGAVQNSEQQRIVKLLRKKARYVVAFGSCAHLGGVPALANLTNIEHIYRTSYVNSPTVDNPQRTIPKTKSMVDGYELSLPALYTSCYKLDDIIEVDYYLPGCPPSVDMIIDFFNTLTEGALPPIGSVLAPDKALCADCDRNDTKPDDIMITEIKRIHEIKADPGLCFLTQGVICMGIATRTGCGYPCIKGNMPCTGCMGGIDNADQGAKMTGSLGGIIAGDDEAATEKVLENLVDPAGTFYRYSNAASFLGRKRKGDQDKHT